MHEFNAAHVWRRDGIAAASPTNIVLPDLRVPPEWQTEMRLICRTTNDRWMMALLDQSVLASDDATLRMLWVIGKTGCMQPA